MPKIENQSGAIIDGIAKGSPFKETVRYASTAAQPASTYDNGVNGVGATLTADVNGAYPVQDGLIDLIATQRGLIKDQADGKENGIYEITDLGGAGSKWVLTRAASSDESSELKANTSVFISEGDVNSDTLFTLTTNDPIVIGTTDLAFEPVGGGGSEAFVLPHIGSVTYPTLTEAKAAANPGDTIVVPGVFGLSDEKNLGKNGVDWHFEKGAGIDFTTDALGAVWDDSAANGSNGPLTFQVTGFGEFLKVTDTFGFFGIVYLENAGSSIYIEALEMDSNGSSTLWADAGAITAKVKRTIESEDGGTVFSAGGIIIVEADTIIGAGFSTIQCSGGGSITATARLITNTNAFAVDSITGNLTVYFDNITTTLASAVNCPGGLLYLKGRRIDSAIVGGQVVSISAGDMTIVDAEIEATANSKTFNNSGGGGNAQLQNCIMKATRDGEVVNIAQGTTKFINSLISQGGVAAGSHGVNKTGGTLVLMSTRIVLGDTAKFDVSAGAAQSITVMGSYTNSAVKDADITEDIEAMARSSDVE